MESDGDNGEGGYHKLLSGGQLIDSLITRDEICVHNTTAETK